MTSFDAIKRERLLALIEAGQTAEQACAATGVGRATVTRWVARGRDPDAPAEVREFSRRYEQLREARRAVPATGNGHAGPLSDEQLVVVLEGAARGGSAESAAAVLARRRREQRAAKRAKADELPEGHPLRYTTLDDPFLAISPDQLAWLTDEQRATVRAIHCDGDPEHDAVIDACMRWAEWARANLEPPYQIDWRALGGSSPYPLSAGPYPPSR